MCGGYEVFVNIITIVLMQQRAESCYNMSEYLEKWVLDKY